MPLYPGGARYELGLWNSIAGTMALELLMFAAGDRFSSPPDLIGTVILIPWAWWFDRHRAVVQPMAE